MQCVFRRRKLATCIPINQTCRPAFSFCGRPVPAMFPVIVSSCKGLVNRLLPSLNLEIPYGDVNDAIDDWSKHHDS